MSFRNYLIGSLKGNSHGFCLVRKNVLSTSGLDYYATCGVGKQLLTILELQKESIIAVAYLVT